MADKALNEFCGLAINTAEWVADLPQETTLMFLGGFIVAACVRSVFGSTGVTRNYA